MLAGPTASPRRDGCGARADHTVAVIGDGALTGGMAWEALNNIAAAKDRPLIIVVNDNERSYAPTIGGLANHLATLRTTDGYERFLACGKTLAGAHPGRRGALYETLHGVKKGLKDIVAPQGMFEDLGLKYVGPIDGHDIEAAGVRAAPGQARSAARCIVHGLTEKGRGYQPAVEDEADQFHGVGKIHPDTGLPFEVGRPDWTYVFGEEMVKLGGSGRTSSRSPRRCSAGGPRRVRRGLPRPGLRRGHRRAARRTMAAGLATGGLHPVFAVYATFLNRAFDQVLMDCALHKCGVTFVLDRAGITGTDGASHNGMWDMSILQVVPGLRIAAPRDGEQVGPSCARPSRSTTRRRWCASPRARSAVRSWRCGKVGGVGRTATTPADSTGWTSGSAFAALAPRRESRSTPRAPARSSTRAGSCR